MTILSPVFCWMAAANQIKSLIKSFGEGGEDHFLLLQCRLPLRKQGTDMPLLLRSLKISLKRQEKAVLFPFLIAVRPFPIINFLISYRSFWPFPGQLVANYSISNNIFNSSSGFSYLLEKILTN